MDYSTISNKTACTEQEELTNGEVSERYYLLKKQYENLSSSFEATRQELHDAKRSYQTALDIQRHLTAELESHHADEGKRKSEFLIKINSLQEEISQLREERNSIAEQHASEIKKLEQDVQRLNAEHNFKEQRVSPEPNSAELDEMRNHLTSALNDLATTKSALEEAKNEIYSWRLKAEEMLTEMGEIKAASEMRKVELQSANEREAVALADLTEARAMLHQYQSIESQDVQPHAAKGNSIFAEVEDKRQEMAKNLIQMKQTNSRLRRELANKQAEVEALLHEKQNVWEQQSGAAAHHDRELIEAYEERITQLEGHCERRRRELARWATKHCDPAAHGWLAGTLQHFKSECEQLRAEVLSQGAAQLASAAQIRDLRRKLAQLTANGGKLPSNTPPNKTEFNISNDKVEISIPKPAVDIVIPKLELKVKSVEDVKKKVSFN